MRSVMKRDAGAPQGQKDERKPGGFPKISFSKVESKVKVLENRPVMQIPDEVPRRRRDDAPSTGNNTS